MFYKLSREYPNAMKEIWVENRGTAKKFGVHHMDEKGKWTEVTVRSERDLSKLKEAKKAGAERAFIACKDWKLIPPKELLVLSKKMRIIARAGSFEEAKEILEIFDKAIAGIFLFPARSKDLEKLQRYFSGEGEIPLEEAAITEIRKTDPGARSCVDTCELMSENEGLLVGFEANGFMLIQAEVPEEAREAHPFRINAGAVSLYTMLPENKTKYLAEIETGDDVLIVDRKGKARKALVGRNRIERRPLVFITAKAGEKTVKALLQDSDNVFVMTPKGSRSVPKLKKGDEILVHLRGSRAKQAEPEVIAEK